MRPCASAMTVSRWSWTKRARVALHVARCLGEESLLVLLPLRGGAHLEVRWLFDVGEQVQAIPLLERELVANLPRQLQTPLGVDAVQVLLAEGTTALAWA